MANTGPEGRFRVRLHEILTLKRRLIVLLQTPFITAEAVDELENERVLTAGTGITIDDNGPSGTIEISATPGTPSDTVEDLDGTGDAGASLEYSRGDHKHGDANRPTDDEKGALVGTGTPSAANPYVTEDTLAGLTGPGGGGGATNGTYLVSGGQYVWVSAYTYFVSAATYRINGVLYASPPTLIALSASDPTNDRFDILVLDTIGLVDVVEGTPSAQPAEPDVDPSTQLRLALIFVEAASSAPGGATSVTVYAENAGGPGEWNWTTSGSGWNLASTNNPRNGSVDIEATAISAGAYIQGQIASGSIDPNEYDFLPLYIRSKATWANNRTLLIRLQSNGVVVGSTLTIAHGTYGFDSSITSGYQQIAIPVSFFSVPAGQTINQIRITRLGPSTIGFYLDDIAWNGTGATTPGGGLTQEQASAQFAPLGASYVVTAANPTLTIERVITAGEGISITDNGPGGTLVIAATDEGSGGSPQQLLEGTEYPIKFTLDAGEADIETGVKRFTALIPPSGYNGTIVEWNLRSPDAGDIEIDVLKNGSSITGGNNPELSSDDEATDTNLSDWPGRDLVGGDRLSIEVLACSGIMFAELQMIVVRS